MNISLVGGGPLAIAIAQRLHAAGMEVRCWNRTQARLAPLREAGIVCVDELTSLYAHTRTVLCCVADAGAMRTIFLDPARPIGQSGHSDHSGPLRIINMGTIGDQESLALERKLAELGIEYADLPLSGGVAGALSGTLAGYVGAIARQDRLLQCLLAHLVSAPVFLDNNQLAQAMKVLNNLCEAVNLWGAAEAICLGERLGLSLAQLQQGLTCGRGNSVYLGVLLDRLAHPGAAVAVALATRQKDIGLARELAGRLGAGAPLLDSTAQLFDRVGKARGEQDDQCACHDFVAALAVGAPAPAGAAARG